MQWTEPYIIFDSGGTSTEILVKDTVGRRLFHREGFNPSIHAIERVESILHSLPIDRYLPYTIRWYGAGVRQESAKRSISMSIQRHFIHAIDTVIDSDIMLCSLVAYQGKEVIVGILGTGANIGHFDGQLFSRQSLSVGYLLGEDGSGLFFGSNLLKSWLYGQMSTELEASLADALHLTAEEAITAIYQQMQLSRLSDLAVKWASQKLDHSLVRSVVQDSLRPYFDVRLNRELSAHPHCETFVLFGSVAHYFQQIIEELSPIPVTIHKSPLSI